MHDFREYEIYDAHAHIFPEKIATKASQAIGDFYDIKMRYPGDSEKLIESGRKINVKKYLVCSTATVPEQTEKINEFIFEECKNHPEFIGFGTLHPDYENIEDEVERIIANGLHGIKLHPDFQKFNIDDNKAMRIYDAIAGRLPVLIHMGDDRYDYSRPYRLVNVMKQIPQLKVFAAHFGGYRRWDEAVKCLLDIDNVYFDTSSTLGCLEPEKSKELIKHFDKDKLMFGTDFPMWDHVEELNRFFALELSDEDNRKILGENFKRILKI